MDNNIEPKHWMSFAEYEFEMNWQREQTLKALEFNKDLVQGTFVKGFVELIKENINGKQPTSNT